ncbi:hypothetical protein FACS189491_11430 [Spirochaetia bacterium]|nr:hypothetical protein FACS189491_11430 [Spirochaetia bacterium]
MDFKVGDVIVLKSGGPKMTVERIATHTNGNEYVECSWFVNEKLESNKFPPDALEKAKD